MWPVLPMYPDDNLREFIPCFKTSQSDFAPLSFFSPYAARVDLSQNRKQIKSFSFAMTQLLHDLPCELLFHIFHFASSGVELLTQLRLVCKQFDSLLCGDHSPIELSYRQELWRFFTMKEFRFHVHTMVPHYDSSWLTLYRQQLHRRNNLHLWTDELIALLPDKWRRLTVFRRFDTNIADYLTEIFDFYSYDDCVTVLNEHANYNPSSSFDVATLLEARMRLGWQQFLEKLSWQVSLEDAPSAGLAFPDLHGNDSSDYCPGVVVVSLNDSQSSALVMERCAECLMEFGMTIFPDTDFGRLLHCLVQLSCNDCIVELRRQTQSHTSHVMPKDWQYVDPGEWDSLIHRLFQEDSIHHERRQSRFSNLLNRVFPSECSLFLGSRDSNSARMASLTTDIAFLTADCMLMISNSQWY